MDFFRRGAEKKQHCLAEEDTQAGVEVDFTAYGIPFTLVTSFRYLGKFLLVGNNDCPEVVRNLLKAWRKWERLTRVLSREGADARTSFGFSNALLITPSHNLRHGYDCA